MMGGRGGGGNPVSRAAQVQGTNADNGNSTAYARGGQAQSTSGNNPTGTSGFNAF